MLQNNISKERPWAAPAIEIVEVSKSFGNIQANNKISLSVAPGTIHGIVGENGAGKSTLMSILYGFYRADTGSILVNGTKIDIRNSCDAIAAGIGMVHQHFMLIKTFTVLENIVLGAEDGKLLKPSLNKARALLKSLSDEYGLDVDPEAQVSELSVGAQQRVEILKALYREARILILDEPTGVLTPAEADQLFNILRKLRQEGKTVVLITHKLREIMAITDTVTVMRRGEMTSVLRTIDTSIPELAELMVGRSVKLKVKKMEAKPGKPVLSVKNLTIHADGVAPLKDVSLEIRAGEILGIAGVAGNGQTELLETLTGMRDATSGEIYLNDKSLAITGPGRVSEFRRFGIGHIPEDRQMHGMVMPFMAWENALFGYHRQTNLTRGLLANTGAMRAKAKQMFDEFDVRPNDTMLKSANFSGGNQQKIVVAREIGEDPCLLVIGQPTRGVDIGAIEFIHKQIIALRDQGKAILLVSVEIDEILGLSDRIAVMCDGRITGTRNVTETNETDLGQLMAGHYADGVAE